MFIFLGYKGISSCIRNGHDRVFFVAFISYLILGFGSFCFHATLKCACLHIFSLTHIPRFLTVLPDPMQLLDELAMIYTTCVLFHAIFSHGRSTRAAWFIALSITSLAAFITAYYHYLQNPVFHQNAFAALTIAVVLRSMYAMEKTLRPSRRPRPASHSDSTGRDRRDAEILSTMWKLVGCGLVSVAVGFLLWNLDNAFCSTVRRWRVAVGLPWGIFLEGHGWW